MPSLLVIIPLIGILILNLPLGKIIRKAAFWLALILTIGQASLVAFAGRTFWTDFSSPLQKYFPVSLAASDDLSFVVLLAIGLVSLAALLVGRGMIADEDECFIFINLLLLAMVGMNGIAMVSDLFSLYVFLEITAVSSFILIALRRDRDGLEGAFKYLVLSAVATVLMLSSIAILFLAGGDTSFMAVRAALNGAPNSMMIDVALCLFIAGLLIKGGLVPFHGWLPDAYSSAPAPASILLAGIITKTTGVYTLMRLVKDVFPPNSDINNILMLVGIVSILVGALAALGQKDFKRMLAYSSISQVGYIILGLGTGTELGFAGAVFHLFNHAVFKSQLFVNAAAVEEQTGSRDMDTMGGLAARMPVTGFTSAVACLSTAGIPPLAGFWSKLVIILALWKAGDYTYAVIAILASIITLAYFLSLQRRVFFGKLTQGFEQLREARWSLLIPAILLTLITIGIGVFFPFFINTIILPIRSIL